MDSSPGKKIVRKVFYTTGSALGTADKIKDSLVDIAKSFKAGYHLLGNEPLPKPSGQQLEGLYGYFGRIIFENIENKNLAFQFLPEYEYLQRQAEGLLTDVTSKEELPKQAAFKENEIGKTEISSTEISSAEILSEDPLIRLKAVEQLSRLNTPQARLALLAHIKDPDSLIRRVIVNSINPEGGEDETFAIVKFINDPDENVARIAIRKSAQTRNRLAFAYLISKLDSENVKIRKEAIEALGLITGSDLGYNPTATIGQRGESVRLWQKVWQDNQMNTQFLMDEEATRSIFKRKYSKKASETPSQEKEEVEKAGPIEKKPKPKNHKAH
jgi:hypothetical protein